MKKLEKDFYNAFKMILGVGEGKAKTLAMVAMNVLLEEANKHSVKAPVIKSVCDHNYWKYSKWQKKCTKCGEPKESNDQTVL